MSRTDYDVVVVGVGGMGSATLYHLARRGARVCGVEQFTPGHHLGSSHGETRIIRKAYFEHPDYLPLLERAYQLWREWETESGERLFVENGLLLAGEENSEVIRGLEACYAAHDLPHERLSGRDAKSRFPQFSIPDDFVAYYDPVAGFLYVERCVLQLVRLARAAGAEIFTGEKVVRWSSVKNGLHVRTTRKEIRTKKLIITAGAWSTELLKRLHLPLEVWRKVVLWYDSPNISDYRLGVFPTFYVETEAGGFYGFPAVDELGVKIGEHVQARLTEPERIARELLPGDEDPTRRFIEQTFPGFQPKRTRFSVCMYTMTPDHNFVIDSCPGEPDVLFAAGFSGHGFKFAPVVGEVLADLALTGATGHPVAFLGLDRLRGQP